MITCPRCGYQAPDGTPWCPRCGYGRPQTQNPQPAGQIPQPRQVPDIPQRPPDPLPERPKQKERSSFGGNCLAIVLMVVFLVLVVIMVVAIGRSRSKPKPTPTPTPAPTLDMTATSEALESIVQEMLEQKMAETMEAAPSAEPTETEVPPAVEEEEEEEEDPYATDYESYCGNMLKVWQLNVDQEKYSGSMTQKNYDPDQNACQYTLSGTAEGSLTLYLDPADDVPYRALFEMNCTYPSDREVMIDWAACVGSYLDFTVPATIKRHLNESIDSGMIGSRYSYTLDRSADPVWKLDLKK